MAVRIVIKSWLFLEANSSGHVAPWSPHLIYAVYKSWRVYKNPWTCPDMSSRIHKEKDKLWLVGCLDELLHQHQDQIGFTPDWNLDSPQIYAVARGHDIKWLIDIVIPAISERAAECNCWNLLDGHTMLLAICGLWELQEAVHAVNRRYWWRWMWGQYESFLELFIRLLELFGSKWDQCKAHCCFVFLKSSGNQREVVLLAVMQLLTKHLWGYFLPQTSCVLHVDLLICKNELFKQFVQILVTHCRYFFSLWKRTSWNWNFGHRQRVLESTKVKHYRIVEPNITT